MLGIRTKVVLTRQLPEPVESRLKELFDVSLRDSDTPMSRAEMVNAIKSCDVLVPTITDQIDAGLLGQAGDNLKLIANFEEKEEETSTKRQKLFESLQTSLKLLHEAVDGEMEGMQGM